MVVQNRTITKLLLESFCYDISINIKCYILCCILYMYNNKGENGKLYKKY